LPLQIADQLLQVKGHRRILAIGMQGPVKVG